MTPPKRPCPYPQTLNMFPYKATGTLQTGLKTLDGEVFLDYLGGPSIISRLLIGGREAEGSS